MIKPGTSDQSRFSQKLLSCTSSPLHQVICTSSPLHQIISSSIQFPQLIFVLSQWIIWHLLHKLHLLFRDAHECVKPGTVFVRPSSFTYQNSTGCECDDFKQVCQKGASGLIPRQRVTMTTEIMQDLNGRNITDYLLTSFDNFTEKR